MAISGPSKAYLNSVSVFTSDESGTWSIVGGNITSSTGTSATVLWNIPGTSGTITITVGGTPHPQTVVLSDLDVSGYNVAYNTEIVAYSVVDVSDGYTYVWSITGGTITSGSGTPNINVQWNTGVTSGIVAIHVTNTNNPSGLDAYLDTTITSLTITGPTDTYYIPSSTKETEVYTVPNLASHTYDWSATTNKSSISGGTTHSATIQWDNTTNTGHALVTSNGVTAGLFVTKHLFSITGDSGVNTSELNEYSVPAVDGYSYNWEVDGGSVYNGQGTNSIMVQWNSEIETGSSVSVTATKGSNTFTAAKSTVMTTAGLWEKFINSYIDTNTKSAVSSLRSGPFSDFTQQSTTDFSDKIAAQVISSSPTNNPNFITNQLMLFASNTETLFTSCEDGSQRLQQLISQYPLSMQSSITYTVNDMLSKGTIPNLYSLKSGVYDYLNTYLSSFLTDNAEFSLCAHPFIRSSAQTVLNTARSFVADYRFVPALNFQIDFATTGLSAAVNPKTISIIVHTDPDNVIGSKVYSTQPSISGLVTMPYSLLKDGDNPLPGSFSGYISPVQNGEIYASPQSLTISINGSAPTITFPYPPHTPGVYTSDINTLSLNSLISDAKIGLSSLISPTLSDALAYNNINTLADVRTVGGLRYWSLLPDYTLTDNDQIAIDLIDSHARLEPLTLIAPVGPDISTGLTPSYSYYASQALIQNKMQSAAKIASQPLAEVIKNIESFIKATGGSQDTNYGTLNSVNVYKRAEIQARLAADYLAGYITLGQDVMENLSPTESDFMGFSMSLDSTNPYGHSTFAENFPEKCSCTDCETAVSPQAYLFELTDFICSSIRTGGNTGIGLGKIDLYYLMDLLHQPFNQLAGQCYNVDHLVCQQRIAVEILRSYNLAHANVSLNSAVLNYANNVYNFILIQIGTSYREALTFKKQLPAKMKSYADRLGIYVDENSTQDLSDFKNLILPDFSAFGANPESMLESLYGIRSTEKFVLSTGLVYGSDHDTGQISRWELKNVQYLKHTDINGCIYLNLYPSGSYTVIELYKSTHFISENLVAYGKTYDPDPTGIHAVTIQIGEGLEESGSADTFTGILGFFEVNASGFSTGDHVYVKPFSTLEARTLKFTYDSFINADFPSSLIEDPNSIITEVAIDPDIISPNDIYYPWDSSKNKVFDLWNDRVNELNNLSSSIDTAISFNKNIINSTSNGDNIASASDIYGNIFIMTDWDHIYLSEFHSGTYGSLNIIHIFDDTSNPIDIYYNFYSTKLLASFGDTSGVNNKVLSLDIDYSTSGGPYGNIDWKLENWDIGDFSYRRASLIRQDYSGNLIFVNTDGDVLHQPWMKYYLPSINYDQISVAEKPFLTSLNTILIPDSGTGAVYEVSTTGKKIQTIGFPFKLDNAVYLKCDEPSTATVAENSISANLYATLTNGAKFSGMPSPDNGITFPVLSPSSYASISSSDQINHKDIQERTVEIWFNCPNILASNQVIYREGNNSTGFIAYIGNGTLYCGYIQGATIRSISTINIKSSTWYQLVFVLNSTIDNAFFNAYINGTLIGSIEGLEVVAHANTSPTSIGNIGGVDSLWADGSPASGSGNYRFTGTIKNFRLWNTAFSDQDISKLYSSYSNASVDQMTSPVAVCNSSTGDIYIADIGDKYIHVYDSNGNYLRKFGGHNPADPYSTDIEFIQGKFVSLDDLSIDKNDNLYVLDGSANTVQVFDILGAYQNSFGIGTPLAHKGLFGSYKAIEIVDETLNLLTRFGSYVRVYNCDLQGNIIINPPTEFSSALTPVDLTASSDGSVTILLNDEGTNNKTYFHQYNIQAPSDVFNCYLGDYYDSNTIKISPVNGKGIVCGKTGDFFVTDYNPDLLENTSRAFSIRLPKVFLTDDVVGVATDRNDNIYLALSYESATHIHGEIVKYDSVGMQIGIPYAVSTHVNGIAIDLYDNIHVVANKNITILTDKFDEIISDASSFTYSVYRISITPEGRLIGCLSNLFEVVDPIDNFGVVLSSIFSQIPITTPISYLDYVNIWWDEEVGQDPGSDMDKLHLSPISYRYLENMRQFAFQQITLTSDWENIKNILINSYKRSQYKTWRQQEGLILDTGDIIEHITYSPYYFNYDPNSLSNFEPIPFRATITDRQNWTNKVAARSGQISLLIQSSDDLISQSDDANLQSFRDAIINLIPLSGYTSVSQKATILQSKLEYDFSFNCCQNTTRVSAALNTLQNFARDVRANEYALDDGDQIQVTHQDFDNRWKVMGSYATWRAATFVYLYPENLLIPSIKPVQSDVFSGISDQLTQNNGITVNDAMNYVSQYTSYFEDICNLSLVDSTRITVADNSQHNFIFAVSGVSDKLYYKETITNNAYPMVPKNGSPYIGMAKTWTAVPLMTQNDDYKIKEFCGLSSLRNDNNIWLYVFAWAYGKDDQPIFGGIVYNTVTQKWDDAGFQPIKIKVSRYKDLVNFKGDQDTDDNMSHFSIKAIKSFFIYSTPTLFITDYQGVCYSVPLKRDGSLNLELFGADFVPAMNYRLVGIPHDTFKVLDVIPIGRFNKNNSLLVVLNRFNIWQPDVWIIDKPDQVFSSVATGNVISISKDYKGFLLDAVNSNLYILIKDWNDKSCLRTIHINDPYKAPKGDQYFDMLDKILTPGQVDYNERENFQNFRYCVFQIDPAGSTPDKNDSDVLRRSWGGGIFEGFIDNDPFNVSMSSDNRLSPLNAYKDYGPNPNGTGNYLSYLQSLTTSLFAQNLDAGTDVQLYLDEAFYYVPMLIAGGLQQSGNYQNALDWYRTIYDYTISPPSSIIYYGLQAYKNQTTLYSKADIYLHDPLNPHSIAVTRPDSYLRYTVASIVNCIIQYADSEFTKDTAESVANADRLYNEAIKLLDTFTYNSPVAACDKVLDALDVVITDSKWLPLWENLISELSKVEKYSDLSGLITEINDIFNHTGLTYAQKFTLAQNRIYSKLQLQEGVLTLNEMQESVDGMVMAAETNNYANMSGGSHMYFMSDSSSNSNPVAYFGLGSNVENAMLYTTTSLLDKTSNRFVVGAAAAGGIAGADVLTMGKTIQGLNNTFPDIPSGNVVVNQTFDASMDFVRGDYNVSPTLTANSIPSQYDVAGPLREQVRFQLTASNSVPAYATAGTYMVNGANSTNGPGTTTSGPQKFTPNYKDQPQTTGNNNNNSSIPSTITVHYKPITILNYCVPKNPILQMLRFHAEINLFKIRNCRDISGAVRELAPFSVPTDATSGLPIALNGSVSTGSSALSNLKPTEFRYSFLIERAKQLCNIAQQMESSLLSIYEKVDAESYSLMKAKQDVSVTKQQVQLQNLQVKSANDQVKVAQYGVQKADYSQKYYQGLLTSGIVSMQLDAIDLTQQSFGFMFMASGLSIMASIVDATTPPPPGTLASPGAGLEAASKGVALIGQVIQQQASLLQSIASFDLEISGWNFQAGLAGIDLAQAQAQVTVAQDQVDIASQSLNIAQLQSQNAEDTVNFLQDKFTNKALYSFMSKQISNVYKYFLTQATSTARMAAVQLSFERQIDFSNAVGTDYYSDPQSGQSSDPNQAQYKGLTGSARLLKDIYILDNNSVNTDIRKLQLTKTISLKDLDPVSFMNFISSGIMSFTTTHDMFDEDFPGQYLRLINSVSVSVIALVPPVTGIRASLRNIGASKVIIGGDFPQEISINRQPDMIAFTSPLNATGTFELQQLNPELYKPFENCGVAMNWVFEMPLYSNRMDFSSIADIQLTINYTALYSDILRSQVLRRLGTQMSARRAFSVQLFYPDAWYDLFNPATGASQRTFTFTITQDNFPVNISNINMVDITMFFQIDPQPDASDEVAVEAARVGVYSLTLTRMKGTTVEKLVSTNVPDNPNSPVTPVKSINNMISGKFRSGLDWQIFQGSPMGKWDVSIDNTSGGGINELISNGQLKDIIFIIDYTADLPPYNVF